jgi:hypothetical protein
VRTLAQLQAEAAGHARRLGHELTSWAPSWQRGVSTACCQRCLDTANVEPRAEAKLEVRGPAVQFYCRKPRAAPKPICRHCGAPVTSAFTPKQCAAPDHFGPCEA